MQTGTWNGFIHSLCCDALTTLRFRHLGHHFLKPGDFADISNLLQNMGQLNYWAKDCTKGQKWSRKKGPAVPYLMYSTLCLATMLHLADATYAETTKRFEFICTQENTTGKTETWKQSTIIAKIHTPGCIIVKSCVPGNNSPTNQHSLVLVRWVKKSECSIKIMIFPSVLRNKKKTVLPVNTELTVS